MKLTLNLLATGGPTTGFVVPPEAVAALEGGKAPKIRVTLNGHTYESKIGIMGGKAMIPVSKDVREKSGAVAGNDYELDIVLDDAPRVVPCPTISPRPSPMRAPVPPGKSSLRARRRRMSPPSRAPRPPRPAPAASPRSSRR